ncbi:MAG: ribonuclease Y [Peptostreptococcaceae bacterium]|nr:ribonuclease Y [Peptostreptococcaceae bacterium]MDY5738817.1 ribonuclease Y [Anaerovoracaceae bacterium]SFE26230.1 ribonucrease Y [Peptostreptococcaceae bacterium pGA-8]
MSPVILPILVGIVTLIIGLLVGYIYRKNVGEKAIGSAEQKAKNLILDAENKSETIKKEIILEAKEDAHRVRSDLEREIKERRSEIQRTERKLVQKEDSLDKKIENIERKEANISRQADEIAAKNKELDTFLIKKREELEKISGYTQEQAKELLLEEIEKDVRHDASVMIRDIEAKAKEEADKKAKYIITGAIQRCAADHVAESTVSVVALPNDDMKGRIIGREGRNIRVIETLTGVDLIIDDTPEAVIISGFDPVRREIARLALEKLILDGRIHPARIEEMVEKATKEVNAIMKEEGEQATFEVGIHNFHPELVKLLGRLKYRTSYGQNVLKHSIEVAQLAGLMAGELGLDVKLAKRAGLLHDIGKALDHEYEGTHVDIGIDILKKYKENQAVINGMAAHHGDYEPQSMEAVLIAAADALSAARPGARRETLDVYIKRLEKLEEIANTTDGVDKAYAIQAGREIRIVAKPEAVRDDEVALLARDIAKKIESELEYPGQIKVNVVRETRAIDYAK